MIAAGTALVGCGGRGGNSSAPTFGPARWTYEGDEQSITTVRYAGSLTTPPCTEGVQWFVVRDPLSMSAAQVKAFTDAYDNNTRPRLAVGGRPVTIDSPSR